MKVILVTTDLSEESSKAYPVAKDLALRLGTSVRLLTFIDTSLHVGMTGPFDMPVAYVPEPLDAVKERVTADLESHCRTYFQGLDAQCEVSESSGSVQDGIADYLAGHDVEFLVMASHGRSGLARTLMGSVTEQVLRRATKPVLVVPVR